MKTRLSFSLILFIITVSTFGQVKQAISTINLRTSPDTSCHIICKITKGSSVRLVNGENFGEWIEISYNGKTGYVKGSYLKNVEYKSTSSSYSTSSTKYYKNSQGHKVQSPTYYDSPPSGATAECYDGTYSFSQSHRGTCSHHGGVKQWLD